MCSVGKQRPGGMAILVVSVLGFLGACDRGGLTESPPPATAPAAPPHTEAPSERRTTELGTFAVESDRLVVSDPAYELGTASTAPLQAVLHPAKRGRWTAEVVRAAVDHWGTRCVELTAYHGEGVTATGARPWKPVDAMIGVDSGQAGIFDVAHFRDATVVPKDHRWREPKIDPDDIWYSLCCDHTLSPPGAGVIPFGAVSISGLGDGGYEAFEQRDPDGNVVAVRVVFVKPEEFRGP